MKINPMYFVFGCICGCCSIANIVRGDRSFFVILICIIGAILNFYNAVKVK